MITGSFVVEYSVAIRDTVIVNAITAFQILMSVARLSISSDNSRNGLSVISPLLSRLRTSSRSWARHFLPTLESSVYAIGSRVISRRSIKSLKSPEETFAVVIIIWRGRSRNVIGFEQIILDFVQRVAKGLRSNFLHFSRR